MSELFLNLLNRAMAAGWLVLVVLLLRLVLKKAPRWIHCLLWALVGLRLVWSFSIESMVSLLPSREVLAPETLYDPTPAVHTGIEFVNTAVNQSFTPAMTAEGLTSVNPLQIWTWLAGWVWAIGAAALLGYALFSFLRLRKRVAVCVEEHGLWRCDAIDSPFILGVFRPRIYVPSDLEGEALSYVAAHERAHLKRRDHWWKPLGYLLLTVFWFHPLLWVGYVLLCRDIELACDENVVRDLDAVEKKAYSLALVDCAVNHRAIAACPVAFGEVGVKQRVKSVLHYKKPAFWVVVIAVVLCVLAAVCFLTDPVTFSPDFDRADMALAQTMDLRLNSGPLTQELNGSELDELWSRLRDLKQTKRGDFYGGFTPFYSLSLQLTDGQWIRIQGYALDGSMTDLVYGEDVYRINDAEFQSYLDRLCAGGSRDGMVPTLRDYLLDLTPSEIGYVSWAGVNEAPTAEALLPMVQRACEHPAEAEPGLEYWNMEFYVGDRNAGTWSGDDAIHLRVGLSEPVIRISGGRNLPDGQLYAADEELYRLLRTMYDTKPRGVDEVAYVLYQDWLDPLLTEPEVLPLAAGNVEITKELTGLVLADNSPTLNAQAYGVDIVWHVEPKEKAFDLIAGGALVDSELNIHGMNASSRYLIVADGEPVGFVGWWFLQNGTLDEQFQTRDALIEAVIHDG